MSAAAHLRFCHFPFMVVIKYAIKLLLAKLLGTASKNHLKAAHGPKQYMQIFFYVSLPKYPKAAFHWLKPTWWKIELSYKLEKINNLIILYCVVQEENVSAKRNLSGKPKSKRKVDLEQMELLNKKVKILGDGMKVSLFASMCVYVDCDMRYYMLHVMPCWW